MTMFESSSNAKDPLVHKYDGQMISEPKSQQPDI